MIEETGFHDVKGIPICFGDLIRVKHFRHYRRKQQMWLYFIVRKLSGRAVVFNYDRPEKHQCLLDHCVIESAEVLAGESYKTDDGQLVMWCERKRKAVQ